MLFDTVSNWVIERLIWLKILTDEQYDDFDYYFKGICCELLIAGISIGLGILLNCWLQVLTALVVFAILRIFIEGYHAPSLEMCLVISTGLLVGIGLLSKVLEGYSWLVLSLSIIGVFIIEYFKVENKIRIRQMCLVLFFYMASFIMMWIRADLSVAISLGVFTVVLLSIKE